MPPKIPVALLRLISRLSLASARPWKHILRVAVSFLRRLATHPQVAELFRFIFLGTIVETGRQVASKIAEFVTDFFVVKAEFPMGDFAYDWVVHYLEHQRVWNESRSFMVVARNAASRPPQSVQDTSGPSDHPIPIYEPATAQSPSLFRWRGYWMSIEHRAKLRPVSATTTPKPQALQSDLERHWCLWSRHRGILDEFVSAAREFYVDSAALPRKQMGTKREPSGSLLTAQFEQSDLAYDWMLEYLRSSDALKDVMDYHVSMKQSHLDWGTGSRDAVRYMPATDCPELFLFKSPRTGRSTWIQVLIHTGIESWDSSKLIGGYIALTLHTSDKQVLADLVECAKEMYAANGASRVTVHLTSSSGKWAKSITKPRRALSTLILPTDIKEMILGDAREFLASEKWYNMAGIPHRRGYLLYGAPGTGKSSTISAIAGELGLEIYFVSLASPGIDDYSLARLISDTPSRCILLLEDIDCAFPSRDEFEDEEEEEQPKKDQYGNPVRKFNMMPPKSAVTLSGLLNVLDSVSSEEGRLTFATTNHIANLDAALIRPGRMDLKIKYGLATTGQIEQVFKVFFPALSALNDDDAEVGQAAFPSYTTEDLERYATDFASTIPSEAYSIAQIQGYLLTKKQDPAGALQGASAWLVSQQAERRAMLEAKRRWREDVARWHRGAHDWSTRGVDAWERVVGDMDQVAPKGECATDAASAVRDGMEEELIDALIASPGSGQGF